MEFSIPASKRQKVIDLSAEESVTDNKLPADESLADDDGDGDDDVVEIIDPPPPSFAAVTPEQVVVAKLPSKRSKYNKNVDNDDDDIQVVGTVNTVQLPHMRPHCTVYPFKHCKQTFINLLAEENEEDDRADSNNDNDNSEINPNRQYCRLCYCYVCDVPAKDCKEWNESHCNAFDKDPFWKRKRRGKKMGSFTVQFRNALLFKKLICNLKQMENDVYIVCKGGVVGDTNPEASSSSSSTPCFQMYAANVVQTGIVRVKIPRKNLAAYLCSCSSSQQQQQHERICVRVDYEDLQIWATVLQKARKLDVIQLIMKEGELQIQLENPKGLKVPDPIKIPVQVDQEKSWFDPPADCEIKCSVRIPSARFKQYISFLNRDMGSSAAEFQCDAKSQKVFLQGSCCFNDDPFLDLFRTTGHIQRARFHITQAQKDTCIMFHNMDNADSKFQQTLNAFYLHAFLKTAAVSPILQIFLTRDNKPCEFRYDADPDSNAADSPSLSFFLEPGLDTLDADSDDDDDDDLFA